PAHPRPGMGLPPGRRRGRLLDWHGRLHPPGRDDRRGRRRGRRKRRGQGRPGLRRGGREPRPRRAQPRGLMRVLFLHRQPCIRALKTAGGLGSGPGPLHLSFAFRGRTLWAWYGRGDELFDEWIDLGRAAEPRDELARAIERARPDLIHSHNLPDVLTVLALETAGRRPPAAAGGAPP